MCRLRFGSGRVLDVFIVRSQVGRERCYQLAADRGARQRRRALANLARVLRDGHIGRRRHGCHTVVIKVFL
jgi:hypothetical protein